MISGLVGFLCVLINPGNPILAGLGIMTTIYSCTALGINSGIRVLVSRSLIYTFRHYRFKPSLLFYTESNGHICRRCYRCNYINRLARPDYLEITDKSLKNARRIIGSVLINK